MGAEGIHFLLENVTFLTFREDEESRRMGSFTSWAFCQKSALAGHWQNEKSTSLGKHAGRWAALAPHEPLGTARAVRSPSGNHVKAFPLNGFQPLRQPQSSVQATVYSTLMVTTGSPGLRGSRPAQPPAPPLRPGLMLPEAAQGGVLSGQTRGLGGMVCRALRMRLPFTSPQAGSHDMARQTRKGT